MNLTELIHYFRNGGSFEAFCHNQSLNPDSEVVEIFARIPLSLESPLAFFEIEKTEGRLEYSHDNEPYRCLFDFYFFQDAIKESNNDNHQGLQDSEIAERLLSYAINDA